MGNEALHNNTNKSAAVSCNYQNVQFTMTRKFQMRCAFECTTRDQLGDDISMQRPAIISIFDLPLDESRLLSDYCSTTITVTTAKSVTWNSFQYCKGQCVVLSVRSKVPTFGCIQSIFKLQSTVFLLQSVQISFLHKAHSSVLCTSRQSINSGLHKRYLWSLPSQSLHLFRHASPCTKIHVFVDIYWIDGYTHTWNIFHYS